MRPEGVGEPLPAPVLAALERGHVIDAIGLLRESTGLGLTEAKAAVDRHLAGNTPAPAAAWPSSLPSEAAAALMRGDKIEAIRIVRLRTGLGLKESREAVESYERLRRPAIVTGAPGEVPRSRGRWVVAVLLATAIVLFLLYGAAG